MIRAKRTRGIYTDDERAKVRCSHQNPDIIKLYDDFLGAPLSDKAHKLLHTHYEKRQKYKL